MDDVRYFVFTDERDVVVFNWLMSFHQEVVADLMLQAKEKAIEVPQRADDKWAYQDAVTVSLAPLIEQFVRGKIEESHSLTDDEESEGDLVKQLLIDAVERTNYDVVALAIYCGVQPYSDPRFDTDEEEEGPT